jgi:hypothetical protein
VKKQIAYKIKQIYAKKTRTYNKYTFQKHNKYMPIHWL